MEKKSHRRITPPRLPPVKPPIKPPVKKDKTLAPHKLMLLVTIVPRRKAEYYVDLIASFECNMQLSVTSFGTSGVFGLGYDIDKQTIFSVIRQDRVSEALAKLNEKFTTIRGGKGVAFTVPFTSMVGVSSYQFLSNKQ